MFKYILLVSLLLLSGCTLNPFAMPSNIDTVEVVKYTPYTKIHQLYISREKLQKFKSNVYLKYFYSKQKKVLYILTQDTKHFLLYNVTKPNTKRVTINKKKYPYRKLVKKLRTAHILPIHSPIPFAYKVEIHYRKLSNIKTLYLKIINYQKLQRVYKKSLLNYNITYINHIKDKLPKKYIYTSYLKSKKNAYTDKQKKTLSAIASKLGFLQEIQRNNTHSQKNNKTVKKELATKSTRPKNIEKNITTKKADTKQPAVEDKNISIPKIIVEDTPYKKKPPYQYFLLSSDLKEISIYLQKAKKNKSLSRMQYKKLLERKIFLKENYLLAHANIEELIRAYKINQKSTFKKRIMELMKEKREESMPIQK